MTIPLTLINNLCASNGNLGAWGRCKAHGEQWGRYRTEPSGREVVECPVEFCEMEAEEDGDE